MTTKKAKPKKQVMWATKDEQGRLTSVEVSRACARAVKLDGERVVKVEVREV